MANDKGPDRMTCGIMALVLGWVGIHKFMMGQTSAGIIQLILSVVTCGAAGIIPFIEAIIYLTKTDEEFYQAYVVEKKAWF